MYCTSILRGWITTIWIVVFIFNPFTRCLQFWNFCLQSDDACNPDRMYDLVAVVIHIGSSLNRGHYISIVKSDGFWLLFDDDIVDVSIKSSYCTMYLIALILLILFLCQTYIICFWVLFDVPVLLMSKLGYE